MSLLPKGLLILGFGGHARSVADVALACGIQQLQFVDLNAYPGESFLGFSVLNAWQGALPSDWQAFPAAGDNACRRQQCEEIIQRGWPLATLLSPTATRGVGSQIAPGTLLAHHAHVGPMASIGMGCIINTSAIVEHEVIVGNYSHVSIGARIAGRSKVGSNVFIGAGATVIDRIQVEDNIILGAGGCAIHNLSQNRTYVGVPAKLKTP
jgi:sugar O-acyltransferase (sialic acid O-acetyltransferase NeuD family)